MNEIFKPLKFDNDYLISNYGNIKIIKSRWKSKINTFLSKRMGGFKKLYVRAQIKGKDYYVHRLVLEHFCNETNYNNLQAAHLDGDPKNNYIGNLIWATPKENSSHKLFHGTSGKGSKNSMSKISENDVLKIRELYSKEIHPKQISNIFNIKNITAIATGRSWKHLNSITNELVEKNKIIAKKWRNTSNERRYNKIKTNSVC